MPTNAELLMRLGEGDTGAESMLVEKNMGLVYSIAGKFAGRGCDREDLVQLGAIGLIKAVKKFDISLGVQFSTYAVPMIIGEIKRFLRDDGAVKVSRSLKEAAAKGRRCQEVLLKELGRSPTISEISQLSGLSSDLILEAFEATVAPESLEAQTDDESSLSLLGLLSGPDTENEIVNRMFIDQSLSALSERERQIIAMRYFKGKTQSEIARVIGVSQVQISRLEKKALLKMRETMI